MHDTFLKNTLTLTLTLHTHYTLTTHTHTERRYLCALPDYLLSDWNPDMHAVVLDDVPIGDVKQ